MQDTKQLQDIRQVAFDLVAGTITANDDVLAHSSEPNGKDRYHEPTIMLRFSEEIFPSGGRARRVGRIRKMAAIIKLRVVDLYHGDRVSSFKKAAGFGIWGIIHKATTGATGRDGKYSIRRSAAVDAGLLWGAYHWGTNANVRKQVDNFLKKAKPDDQTLMALDCEDPHVSLSQAREFLVLLAEKLGRKPVLYSGSLIKERLGNRSDAFFG
jgi:Glycosyl hydrolases family 25